MHNFEQSYSGNIEMDGKVVFTAVELEDYVDVSGLNIYYETHGTGSGNVCDPNSDMWEVKKRTPINEYLDDDVNFQSACQALYNEKFK